MAAVLDQVVEQIHAIQRTAREQLRTDRPRWPIVVLRTPKGWTGPRPTDSARSDRTLRVHHAPLVDVRTNVEQLATLEAWLRGYRPEELFDQQGRLLAELAALAPKQYRRMSANPCANGGTRMRDLGLPDFTQYGQDVAQHGATVSEPTRVLAQFLRDVMQRNPQTFRLFGPDETAANHMAAVLDVTTYAFNAAIHQDEDDLSPDGRLMEVLSEHVCQGWLEGYLLTGRHGILTCSEAFIHVVDSMFNQHAKWLIASQGVTWRRPIASLNYVLSSLVWRQGDSGFSHQDPGFIDQVVNKKAEIIRVYLPPDANCLLSVADHCLRSRHYVNVMLAGKTAVPNWLSMPEAILHCSRGLGIWDWASNDNASEPDVVLACCGDVPTLETLAAVALLRQHLPELKVRVVNVVDLMRLQPAGEHPHGLSDAEFDAIFTADRPVVFAYHGYPWLIHRLTYRRTNHRNLHVRGYKEEGTTTTPFDLVMRNDMDRFHLVMDVIDRIPGIASRAGHIRQLMVDKRHESQAYARREGDDMPEIRNWTWPG
jgi:xylulose-5-phosphate/fructose-6-phosphate phosphoketolase